MSARKVVIPSKGDIGCKCYSYNFHVGTALSFLPPGRIYPSAKKTNLHLAVNGALGYRADLVSFD